MSNSSINQNCMRIALPSAVLFTTLLFSTPDAQAQNDRFAYAITDLNKIGSGWNALRKLDLQTGQYSEVLLNGAAGSVEAEFTIYEI